jgi:DNA-binding MarR family transcriptional regulator
MPATPLSRRCADDVLDLLPGAMDALRFAMRSQLEAGLSVPQFRGLNYIAHHDGSSLSEVAAFLGVTLATASAMVDRLVRAGHVQSTPAADDRRRVQLKITAAGRSLLDEVRTGARRDLAERLGAQPAETLEAIRHGLAALKRALS